MELPPIVSEQEWQEARDALLVKEKELTHARDALAAQRRRIPRMLVEKQYEFDGPDGRVSLLDLFEGRRQLMIGHFMFDPRWEDGCPSCSAGADDVAPGLLAVSSMNGAMYDSTFNIFFRLKYAKLYDAILATPMRPAQAGSSRQPRTTRSMLRSPASTVSGDAL